MGVVSFCEFHNTFWYGFGEIETNQIHNLLVVSITNLACYSKIAVVIGVEFLFGVHSTCLSMWNWRCILMTFEEWVAD